MSLPLTLTLVGSLIKQVPPSFTASSSNCATYSGSLSIRPMSDTSVLLTLQILLTTLLGHPTSKYGIDTLAIVAMTPSLTWHERMPCKVCILTSHFLPPHYNHCILGKQMRLAVHKVQKGKRVTCPLERVFVDLCRPKPCRSQSGQLYSMNVIDDFSSYIWSLPLRNKEEAASVFQLWHCAVENQSGHCLKILVSDNGKLISNSMHEWASTHGVDH